VNSVVCLFVSNGQARSGRTGVGPVFPSDVWPLELFKIEILILLSQGIDKFIDLTDTESISHSM
jgi:hypothetical protein